jgi:type II secretory ATPase GspE/PulE/Tfp pilus assembly ATPase PilB-like protein
MTDAVRGLIITKASIMAIKSAATSSGFKTMRKEELINAAGTTTVEEVLRVMQEAEGP